MLRVAGLLVVLTVWTGCLQAQTTVKPGSIVGAGVAPAPSAADHRDPAALVLKTDLSSRNAEAGKPFKATLKKAIVLPDGTKLARGTEVTGKVTRVSRHGKGLPNGALMLLLDEAHPKDGAVVPLQVTIVGLNPVAASEYDTVNYPRARMGGTANSGGQAQMAFEANDRSSLTANQQVTTFLKDVYLERGGGGSGVVFALQQDLYLDSGIELVVMMDKATSARH